MKIPHAASCSPGELSGPIIEVDDLDRGLIIQAGGSPVRIDVPPGCPITLNGEAVRLRLLQPADEVQVQLEWRPRPTARVVRVRGPQLRGA
jgi:hypothetical protein